jgi:hypothetical protein
MPGGSAIGKLYIDPLLSNFAVTYRPQGFISQDVLPIIQVAKQSGIYARLEQADQFRIPDTTRAPGDEAKITRFRVGSDNYFCVNRALKTRVPVEDLANAQPPFLQYLEQARTGTTMNQLLLDLEKKTADIFATGAGSSAAVASAWSVLAGAGSPFNDINVAKDNVRNSTGYHPNTIIFGYNAWEDYRRHNETINKVFRTAQPGAAPTPGDAELATVARIFDVQRVFVGRAYKQTGAENITAGAGYPLAANIAPVWSNFVWVGYQKMDAMTVEDPTFAAAFRWTVPGIPSLQVERLPYNAYTKSEDLEVGYYQIEKLVDSRLGFLITGA